MSLRPKLLCKLKHGKALSAFPTFVETFNWLVDFCTNLSGDGDVNADSQNGADISVFVDKSTSDHPVIRLVGEKSGGESCKCHPRPFEIVEGVVQAGSIPAPIETLYATSYVLSGDGTVFLHADRVNGYYSLTINQTSRNNSATHAQFALYEIQDGKIVLDSRPSVLPLFAL